MPLKESDLKDAESYKKASRLDLSKLSSGNAKFWVYKDVELPGASGKKKYPAFLALVDDNGIRKAMTGKKLICKGTCCMKEDRIAFEPTTGAVPYKLLKVSVPLLLGKPVLIPTGKEEVDDEEAAEESVAARAASGASSSPQPVAKAPEQAPPVAPPSGLTAAALTGAWSKLVKDVQAYAAAHPDQKTELFRDMNAIGALLKANNAAEAKPKMDHMQELLAAPPATPPSAAATQQQLATRWTALAKRLQQAVGANPERKAELVRASAGLADLVRAGKFEAAAKQMDAVEQALVRPPEPSTSRPPAPDLRKTAAETSLKQEEEEEAEEDDDEESKEDAAGFQKDLKNRMVAAMAQVKVRMPRPGQDPKPQMRFIAYLAGKQSSVIVAKKAGGALKKVLMQLAGVAGGKVVLGECIFENNAHTFVLKSPPGGMAKLLSRALLAEAGMKYKVRVRALDGSVVLDDETDVDLEETGDSGLAAWEKRFGEVEPRYLDALKEQPANASEMRAAMTAANIASEKRDFAAAMAALSRLETLIEAAKNLGKETDVIPEGMVQRTVAQLEKASSRWRQVQFKSVDGLESLMEAMRAEEDPDLHEIADKVDRLTNAIPSDIEAAIAQLSTALQAPNGADIAKYIKQVEAAVEGCEHYLAENQAYIDRCEDNPFDLLVSIQEPIRATLAEIRASLSDLQA
jgi:hypothetical protein